LHIKIILMKFSFLISLVLSCFFISAYTGHIYSQDIVISPNNKNNPSAITFIFTLDTSLAPTDYLRIVLPFKLNSIQPAAWAPWSLDATTCTASGTSNLAVVTDSTLATQEYFVQFYTDNTQTTLSGLTAGTAYYVTITGTPDSSSQTGINLPVELYTVSDITQNTYIVYDSNPTFGTITLADPFASTMTVSTAIPSTDTASSTVLGATYRINIDITPKTTLRNRARIDISLTNTAFTLISCNSIASAAEKITALAASYSSLNAYTIRATIPATLTAGSAVKYRFQCQITNPTLPGTTRVNIQNRYGYIETITESGTSSINLQAATTASSGSSSVWSETNHQIQLGWGFPASTASALSIISLYKDASTTERWYQSAKTIFQPLATMTSTAVHQVVVSTVNDAGFKILAASIYHNLPAFTGLTVTCDTNTQGYLYCKNVGALQAQSYFISFKFNLLSTTTATSVADFGKVAVQTQATTPVILLPLSQTTLNNKAIATNVALFTGTNGIIASSTTTVGSVTTPYVTNGQDISLKFTFNYFTNTFLVSPLTTAVINKGIEFYTSQALATPSGTVGCTINTLSVLTDVLISNCAVESLTSFTRLRFRIGQFKQTGAPVSTLFSASTTSGTVVFSGVQFSSSQFSSLNYVSSNTFDYYARWVQDFAALTPNTVTATGSSPFFFNSLVYTNGGLANVNVGTTFFATGATSSDAANTGSDFPTLIRITGYLSAAEQAGAQRLLLFFNDLVPLNTDTPCFGPTGIVCKYNENGIDNTYTNTLTDYSGSRRIEITTDLTQRFNIYIPVSTIATKTTLGFFIASATTVSIDASAQGIYSSMHSKRIAAVTSTATTFAVNPVTAGSTPSLGVTGTPAMGSAVSPSLTVQAAYTVPTPNSGTNIGAAYGYCANYDFTTASGFRLQAYYTSTSTPQELCVTLSYPYSDKTVTCNVCPVHSAMSAGTLSTTSFTMPTMAGVDLYQLAYVVGRNNGDFRNAAYDNQAAKLSPLTLTSTSISFSPTALNKDGKNVYAELKFTVVSALPKKIRINITPSSGTLYMIPINTALTGVSCEPTTVSYTSCAASGTASNIQLDVQAGELWAVGEHKIRFMVDSTASGIGADTVVNYGMTIMVDGVATLGAIHHRTTTSYSYTVKSTTTDYIVLSNITYLFGTEGARTIVKFAFELPAAVSLYSAQELRFDLGGIAAANIGEEPICVVRNNNTGEASNDFSTCDTTDLTVLTLDAKSSASGAYILELGFLKVPSSGAPAGITCKIVGVDGSTVVAQSDPSNPLTLPAFYAKADTPAINIVYNRLYADPGSVSEIVLTIKPSVSGINVQSSVYVYFPQYYAGKLGYENIWCTANSLPLPCTLLEQRVIQLNSFPITAAVGAAVAIRIYGIITPVVPDTPGKIFIAIDNNDDYNSLTEQIEISDTASNSATPNALTIDRFSVSTNLIREQADYTIVLTTDAIGIRANRIISIDFPDRYGNILRGQTGPKIAISKTGETTVTTVQSSAFGSRFKIVLPANLDPLTSYTFVIKAIDNPENPVCIMDRPMISVTDSSETSVSTRSACNIYNAASVSYFRDPTLKALSWTDASGNAISAVTLSIGIFSAPIRILPPTGENFINDVTFSISDSAISLLPLTLTATRGSPYLSLRVSASSSSYPGITLLSFTKEESTTTNIYMEIAKLQLTLTNNKKTLPTYPLRIMKGGTSLPYRWELDTLNLIPNSELKIQATITAAALSPLSIQGASVLTFGPDAQKLGFTFLLSKTADAATPPSFTLAIGGEDSGNYGFAVSPTLITVDVLAAATDAPQILTLGVTSDYAPTQQEMELTLDQMASVYWHVAYENFLSTTTCERVRALYNQGTAYDSTSSTQVQYGVFYVYDENVVSPQVISNLFSNEVYSYVLCPSNQLAALGTATTGTFTTADNTARLDKVTITFTKAITQNQLKILVCLFKTELQVPDRNIVAMDGTSCSQASVFKDFSSFDYQNVVIWIHGDRASDFTSATSTLLTQYVTSVQSTTASDFLTAFNTALRSASLTNLYSTMTLAVGPTYSLPALDSGSSLTVTANATTITVKGFKLNGDGVIYAVASTDLTNAPSPAQVKASLDYSSSTVPSANALYSGTPVSLTLTGLNPLTTYSIYYFASTADRTQYARVTPVNYIQKATTKTQTVSATRLEISLVLTSLLALFAFLL